MRIRTGVLALATASAAMTYASRNITNPKVLGSTWGRPLIFWGTGLAVLQSLSSPKKRFPHWRTIHEHPQGKEPSLRICFANVLLSNPKASVLGKEISEQNPDVVILAETDNLEWGKILMAEFPQHHYRYTFEPTTPGSGFRILSRLPITRVAAHRVGPDGRAFIAWQGRTAGGKWVSFIAVHPAAPVNRRWSEDWALYLNALQGAVPAEGPLVIVGDFNATRNHGPFRKLCQCSGGDVVTKNVPTWPQNHYSYYMSGKIIGRLVSAVQWLLPLDQAIVRGLRVSNVEVGSGAGSDHRPIYVDLGDLD